MTGFVFLLAFASLPLLGLAIWRLPSVAALPLPARLAAGAAAGAVFLTVEMLLFSLAGIPWSVPLLALLPVASSLFVLFRKKGGRSRFETPGRFPAAALSLAAAAVLLAAFSAATARATSMDLLFFWGAKGLHFAKARALDTAFLTFPGHELMHPGYPPLLPLLYAWASLAAGRFAWGASLLTMPLFLVGAVLTFRGFSRRPLGERESAEHTALLAALLAFGLTHSLCAGNAEPALLFFETIALCALTFGERGPNSEWLASLGLAGAVMTKVEGAAFAAAVGAAFLLSSRERKRRLASLGRLALAPLLFLGCWLIFIARHGIADSYAGREYGAFALGHWREVVTGVLTSASFGIAYLPWIALATLVLLGRSRRALPFLLAAAAYVVFIVFSYLHGESDPREWIRWSGSRLLLTPLLILFFGAAAASGPEGDLRAEPAKNLEDGPIDLERQTSPLATQVLEARAPLPE
jgi:hypothetical protein